MLARETLRDESGTVRARLESRGFDVTLLDRWQQLDTERRSALVEIETLKHERNESSKSIGQIKREGGDASEQIAAVGLLKGRIGALESLLEAVNTELHELDLGFPNLPDDCVPEGADESDNRLERQVGTRRDFDFEPQAHWDLGPALGIIDFERGAKLAGARFTVLAGAGARLERALTSFMLDLHTEQHGYFEILPPFIANRPSLIGTGQLPKFEHDIFKLEGHDYFLIPTAEVPVTNLHRDEILDATSLPRRYTAYTPCFRAEAGSHGQDVRGLIRQHQFDKVELVQFVEPEHSWDALEALTGHAETVLQRLDLPYQVVTLSSGDIGFSAAKTYDLEVWLPGQGRYREISSCSNFLDFQARRANLRYRPEGGGKPRFLHTLNGSGLAIGRTLIAILENHQQEDGSVTIPDALRPYMAGRERIDPPSD